MGRPCTRHRAARLDRDTEDHVWSEQYEHQVNDVSGFAKTGRRSKVVRRTTGESWRGERRPRPTERPPGNAAACDEHYLRGRHHVLKGTKEGFSEKAREHFQSAIALDPARTHTPTAVSRRPSPVVSAEYALMPIAESHPLARECGRQSPASSKTPLRRRIDPAAINGQHYWQWAEAEDILPAGHSSWRRTTSPRCGCIRSISPTPDDPRKDCRSQRGRSSLDPVSDRRPTEPRSCSLHGRPGRRSGAAARGQHSISTSNFGFAHAMLGLAYASKGMPERAVAEADEGSGAGRQTGPISWPFTASRLPGRDDRREALATLEDIRPLTNPQTPSTVSDRSSLCRSRGLGSRIRMAREGSRRAAWEVPLLKADPVFERLRLDP